MSEEVGGSVSIIRMAGYCKQAGIRPAMHPSEARWRLANCIKTMQQYNCKFATMFSGWCPGAIRVQPYPTCDATTAQATQQHRHHMAAWLRTVALEIDYAVKPREELQLVTGHNHCVAALSMSQNSTMEYTSGDFRIHGGEWIVHDKQGGGVIEGTGDGKPLLLPATEGGTPFAHLRVQAACQLAQVVHKV